MQRRRLLSLLGASALAHACARASRGPAPIAEKQANGRGIAAIAFDLFTLFDPRGIDHRVTEVLGDTPLATTWKTRLFEYSWLRAAAGRYVDFEQLTHDSLSYAARTHNLSLTEQARERLESVFTELVLWPDARTALANFRAQGLRLAPLANFAPHMLEVLLENGAIKASFDALISTDRARTYKPDPRAYALGEMMLGLPRERIAFAAFGGWDAVGASWFGYPAFWVNRFDQPHEELDAAVASGPDLQSLARWIAAPA